MKHSGRGNEVSNYLDIIDQDIRLIILKALAEQDDYSLHSEVLAQLLERFGHNVTRDYVHNQFRWLEKDARAITIVEAGSVLVATLTQHGLSHVQRKSRIEGVKRPSPGI